MHNSCHETKKIHDSHDTCDVILPSMVTDALIIFMEHTKPGSALGDDSDGMKYYINQALIRSSSEVNQGSAQYINPAFKLIALKKN